MKTSVEIKSKLAAMLSQVRTIGAGVWVGVGVGVGVGIGSGVGVGVGVGIGVSTGAGFAIATPLFHTSLLPDLMQVNFFPDAVAVDPTFVHLAPALAAANDGAATIEREMITDSNTRNFLRTM